MNRFLCKLLTALLSAWLALAAPIGTAQAQATSTAPGAAATPDEFIRLLGNGILDRIREDPQLKAGDVQGILKFVDETVMPNVDFERMTALATGRHWRQATPQQQRQLMAEFRTVLVRTYAGAVASVKDQQLRMKPMRAPGEGGEYVVRSEIVSTRSEPIEISYRVEKSPSGWKIFDFNVMGVWLIEAYRGQFSQELSARGMDGLIQALAERNRKFTQAKTN
jgi:phospholipid transport system substrate-binding protein